MVRPPFGPCLRNVGSRNNYLRPSVHCHGAWFVTDPALCDKARVGLFHNVSAWCDGLTFYAGFPYFLPSPAHFPTVVLPPISPFCLLLGRHSDFVSCSRIPFEGLSSCFRRWSSSLHPSRRTSYSGCGLAPHSSSTLIVFGSLSRFEATGSPRMSFLLGVPPAA
jgi:hypothetical protein